MRWPTIAGSFVLSCMVLAAAGSNAVARQAASTPSTAHSKTSHKHKHVARKPAGQKAPTADRISEIQSALARGGYYQGDPNGKLDSNTVGALQKFQSANGLDASGKLDAPTLQKLGLGSDIAGVGAPKPVVPSCCSANPSTSAPAPGAPSSSATNCCSMPVAASSQASVANNNGAASASDPSDSKTNQK